MSRLITIITTMLETLGLVCIVAGIWLLFGMAVALIAAGLLLVGVSFLVTTRGGRK